MSSTALREKLVTALGKAYPAAYSLLALAILVWMVSAYKHAPLVNLWYSIPLQRVPQIVMPFALLAIVCGVLTPNPTVIGKAHLLKGHQPARGRAIRDPEVRADLGAGGALDEVRRGEDVGKGRESRGRRLDGLAVGHAVAALDLADGGRELAFGVEPCRRRRVGRAGERAVGLEEFFADVEVEDALAVVELGDAIDPLRLDEFDPHLKQKLLEKSRLFVIQVSAGLFLHQLQ